MFIYFNSYKFIKYIDNIVFDFIFNFILIFFDFGLFNIRIFSNKFINNFRFINLIELFV